MVLLSACASGDNTGISAPISNNNETKPLHVEGTKLVDSQGKTVVLKGISTHNIAWYPQFVDKKAFKQFHDDWGADVIRLSMYTAAEDGYCTDGNRQEMLKVIDNGVRYAENAGIYAIIDWHILTDGDPTTYQTQAEEFFAYVSAQYADNDNVLYEICNEPNGNINWQVIKNYAEDIIPVIRENDKDAIILVGTPNWCQFIDQAAEDPITDYDNIMYTFHFYAGTHKENLRSDLVKAVKSGLPVFVSEYGICDASGNGELDMDEAEKWIEILDEYQISRCMWNLSNKDESSAIIKPDCSKTNSFTEDDLSESGKWLKNELAESE